MNGNNECPQYWINLASPFRFDTEGAECRCFSVFLKYIAYPSVHPLDIEFWEPTFIHMVIGMDRIFWAKYSTQNFYGPIRNDLVRIHIRLCTGSGLPNNLNQMTKF